MFEVDRLIRIIRTNEKRSIRSRYNRVSRSESFSLSLYIFSIFGKGIDIESFMRENFFVHSSQNVLSFTIFSFLTEKGGRTGGNKKGRGSQSGNQSRNQSRDQRDRDEHEG